MTDKELTRQPVPDVAQESAERQNTLLVDSAVAMSTPAGAGADLAQKISQRTDQAPSADATIGGKFELVGANSDGQIIKAQAPSPEEIQRGIRALVGDAIKGDSWSQDSIDTFKKVLQSESDVPNATPESVARGLNAIGAAINGRVHDTLAAEPGRRADPIGMAVLRNEDGSYTYYMTLNKDAAALARNQADLMSGKSNPAIIKLGPYTPGQKI